MSDAQELNEILKAVSPEANKEGRFKNDCSGASPVQSTSAAAIQQGYVQWASSDGRAFFPAAQTVRELTPGVYDIQHSQSQGLYFQKIPVLTTGLIRFPETNSDRVVDEIQKFWSKEEIFREYNLNYKRGIMLWGPPGSGKSCTIQLIMRDVVDRNGIVVKFGHPDLFSEGMRKFREIQPNTPVVVLMEDIDSILECYNESSVLNILDGVSQIEKAVFLATTNYPEKLGARIINRPSRFDKRFKIGHPNSESRKIYFEYIMGGPEKVKELDIDMARWVEDTDKFSIAHLKELFTAVVILGDDYEEAIEALSSMKEEKPDSSDDEYRPPMGFGASNKGSVRGRSL